MGLIDSGTKVTTRHEKVIANGFPVQTNEVVTGLKRQVDAINQFKNVHLIGRASGEGWFLDSLIKNAYRASEVV